MAAAACSRRNVDQFGKRGLGKGEALVEAAHDERGNDGEGEGDAKAQRGSLAQARVEFHLTADFFDVGAHDVHADAAATDVGNLRGGGEAGKEDHLQELALRELGGARRRDEAALDGLGADLADGDAGAVVGDFDDYVAAFLHGAQDERAFRIFACSLAHIGRLDAVVERVAHSVGERIFDGLEEALVEFGLLAFKLEIDAAAERLREVADHARDFGEDVGDGLHARLHHGLAQVGGDHIEAAREHGHVGIGGSGLQNLVAGEHQFADQVHHAVEQGDIDAQECFPRRSLRMVDAVLRNRRRGRAMRKWEQQLRASRARSLQERGQGDRAWRLRQGIPECPTAAHQARLALRTRRLWP